jgi:hypothetical protein
MESELVLEEDMEILESLLVMMTVKKKKMIDSFKCQ